MRQLVQLFAIILVASLGLMAWANALNRSAGYAGADTITVFNWGDYIDPELLEEFQEQTGITVIYETFDSNEAMMTKIAQGGTTFDVAMPSEYAVERLMEDGMLVPLDHSKLPNLVHIDPRFLDMSYDPGNRYSVPYFWGTVGILYNPEAFDEPPSSWDALWDPKLKNDILLVDGAREIVGMGLNSLGYSLNDTDEAHLQEALAKLKKLTPNVKAIVGDEIKMLMIGNEASAAVVWSGDAAEVMWENEDLDYIVPEEGSNVWFDTMVIPKTARNIEGAHLFINFMLDPENAARNAEYVGYSTPNATALELLDEEISGDERFYPDDETIARLEVYENLGKRMLAYYNDLFLEFKMHAK
jgi:spermidine/putrescine transport system substrate-binding protein